MTTTFSLSHALVGLLAAAFFIAVASGCENKSGDADGETPEVSADAGSAASTGDKADADAGVDKTSARGGDAGADDVKLKPGTEEQLQILARAKTSFLSDDLKAAERQFEELISTGPVTGPQVTAYIALGQIYRETDREEKALELYESLAEEAPDIAEVQFVLARALAEQGESTRAMRAYRETLKLEPNYLQAYVELAGLLTDAGREKEAEPLFLEYEKRVYALAERLESARAPPEMKVYILDVFSFVDDDRANQAIVQALQDSDASVREKAVHLTAELGIGEATPKVSRMAENDPNVRVRMAAKAAVKRLEDAPADGASPEFVDDPSKLPESK